jgi:hypothetical protein
MQIWKVADPRVTALRGVEAIIRRALRQLSTRRIILAEVSAVATHAFCGEDTLLLRWEMELHPLSGVGDDPNIIPDVKRTNDATYDLSHHSESNAPPPSPVHLPSCIKSTERPLFAVRTHAHHRKHMKTQTNVRDIVLIGSTYFQGFTDLLGFGMKIQSYPFMRVRTVT